MQAFLSGASAVLWYILPVATIMFTARRLIRIPDELFRKLLHFILLGAYIPFLFAFDVWWMAAGLAAALAVVLYPLLLLAGHIPGFTKFTTQRKEGEFAGSCVLAFLVMALSICVCWGIFGKRLLVLACVYAWGVGDAFAALVGKRFGRHKLPFAFADRRKSAEGSAAMFVTSALAVLLVLLSYDRLPPAAYAVIPAAGAGAATLVEMVTRDGRDTLYCPAAAMAVIIPLMALFGGL